MVGPRGATRAAVLIFCVAGCAGRPRWVDVTPEGYQNNYAVGSGASSASAAAAREGAVADALAKLVRNRGVTVSLADSTRTESRETLDSLVRRTETVRDIVQRGRATEFRGLFEAAQFERQTGGAFQAWTLIGVPRPAADIRPTPSAARAVLLSALVPGAGQLLVKGDRNKGFVLLTSGLGFAGGALAFNGLRSSELAKIRGTNSQAQNDAYQRRANDFDRGRMLCLAGAVAAWGFSIIDAAAARPKYFVRATGGQLEFGRSLPVGSLEGLLAQ
jgi:hypothetical protein